MKKNNINKVKEIYIKFKEVWKDPRKKAGIKLLGYLIFFILLLLSSAIMNNMQRLENNKETTTSTTTKVSDKYKEKQQSLLLKKHSINYVINVNDVEYKINGYINNNIIEGYLEQKNDIKKIIFRDNILYEIIDSREIILETDINKDFLNLNYIIKLIEQNSAFIEDNDTEKKYTYNIDNNNIVVNTDENNINKIVISNGNDNYELNFDI